jgi:Sulfate permease family
MPASGSQSCSNATCRWIRSAANVAAAVSGAFVVNGSPTQTAMADRAGARSQLAQQVFAGIVLLVPLAFVQVNGRPASSLARSGATKLRCPCAANKR